MDHEHQPAMRSGAGGPHPYDRRATWAEDPDLHVESDTGARALRRGGALIRWAALILLAGLGVAVVVGIAVAGIFVLVNASV